MQNYRIKHRMLLEKSVAYFTALTLLESTLPRVDQRNAVELIMSDVVLIASGFSNIAASHQNATVEQ